MRALTTLAAVAALTLGLAGCGGAGANCGDFKNADKTVVAVKDGIAAGIASGKIKADEVAKKIADATPEGAKVPGGDIKKACEFYAALAGDYGIALPKAE